MSPYVLQVLSLFNVLAIAALGLNVVVGYSGILSVTQGALVGVGAYVGALVLLAGGGWLMASALAIAVTAALGCVVQLLSNRALGDYYIVISLGIQTVLFAVMLNWQDVTRGSMGLSGIPGIPAFAGGRIEFWVVSFAVLILAFLLVRAFSRSFHGTVLRAIRSDEIATLSLGKPVRLYKVGAFVFGAALSGVAGLLYATLHRYIDPYSFQVNLSILLLSAVIVGGLGNVYGSLVGVGLIVALPEALRFVPMPSGLAAHINEIVYYSLLILFVLFRRQGIVPEFGWGSSALNVLGRPGAKVAP